MLGISPFLWLVGVIGALGVGVSKTGIAGLGILAVALFAIAFPGTHSPGIVLPILISADIVAVQAYRKHADWSHLWGLYPWTAAGVVLGALLMGRLSRLSHGSMLLKQASDIKMSHLIGAILVLLCVVQVIRKIQTIRRGAPTDPPKNRLYAAGMGLLAGFTTMVANAAGPVMVLYLLASGLPTMEFMGTGAWFFFTVNLFKVPFSYLTNMMSPHTLLIDCALAPFAVIGAIYGKQILQKINRDIFENAALGLTAIAAAKLLTDGVSFGHVVAW